MCSTHFVWRLSPPKAKTILGNMNLELSKDTFCVEKRDQYFNRQSIAINMNTVI